MNTQPIEKYVASDGMTLDVHSIFYTIQGEGPYQGRAAVFVRLAGCNLQCPLCDTDYTSVRTKSDVMDITRHVLSLLPQSGPAYMRNDHLVVITGGEPFRQNIAKLCKLLLEHVGIVQVETNGTLPPSIDLPPSVDIIVSPKTPKVNRETEDRALAFKYVLSVYDVAADGLPTSVLGLKNSSHVARPRNPAKVIYLQPADYKDEVINGYNRDAVAKSCMANGYRLQAQLHKLFNLE